MIEQYLNGDMYLLQKQEETIGICIIVKKEQSIYEIKNIAIIPSKQQLGYGQYSINWILKQYPDMKTMYVGTGESIATISFYTNCGFTFSHRIPNFFYRQLRKSNLGRWKKN